MFLGRTFFLVLTLASAIHGQEEPETRVEEKPQLSHLVSEEFLPIEEEGTREHFLRGRELQYSVCQAITPAPLYVCGEPGSPPSNRCQNSAATCNGTTYGCVCNGVTTQCNYCEIRMLGSIICQIAGTTTTVSDTADGLMTCSCVSLGNGQVERKCASPVASPVPLPTPEPGSYWALLQPPVAQAVPPPSPAPVVTYSLTASTVNEEVRVGEVSSTVPVYTAAPVQQVYYGVESYPHPPKQEKSPKNRRR